MSAIKIDQRIHTNPFVGLDEPEAHEFVGGKLLDRTFSVIERMCAGEVLRALANWSTKHKLGLALPGNLGYRCFEDDPRKVRRPEVSFIQQRRLTRSVVTSNEVTIPPDLVAEVVSPNDLSYEIEARVKEYLNAGVQLIWVINPDSGIVQVYRADGSWSRLTPDDELSGEDVVEGFSCRIADLFLELPAE